MINRREFIKKSALTSAAVAGVKGIPNVSFTAFAAQGQDLQGIQWQKTPCRFCGTGCGLLVGVKAKKAVAVKGDPACSVNRGLACVKGYHSILALYGKDRLKKALIRTGTGFREAPVSEALDLVAAKIKETVEKHGKDSVAIYGSGQWTIPDGYVASKFLRAGIGTNNIEANARLCMASAVTGFLTSFGQDEPMGCYDDIDHSNVFVLWGNNMTEMHPVLFSRMIAQRTKNPNIKIYEFATRFTPTSKASDGSFIFKPQTDLAILNAIALHIIESGSVNEEFVKNHCHFKSGKTNIGYGLKYKFKFSDKIKDISFEEYRDSLKEYTPENVEKLSGVPAADTRKMASIYADPSHKISSFWCMGFNQHSRGTWVNNLIYNIHLLTGKISSPGNNPFSLTGQPSACGTVREVGTLTHKLPKGVVNNEDSRKFAAKIWNVPVEKIPAKPTHHTVSMFRALEAGDIKFMWTQVTNPAVSMPNLNRYPMRGDDRFIVVSDVYPTPTTAVADVVLPSAMWIEREGMYGNSERRTQHFNQMLEPPGEAMSDTWQIIEVAKRMGYGDLFPWTFENHIEEIWKEYTQFHAGKKHGMASYKALKENAGVMWPNVDGKETKWRFNTKYDPATKNYNPNADEGFEFYGKPEGKAWIITRPYEPPAESPDAEFPFWLNTGRVLEHWHTGSMTRRVAVLHKAKPEAYAEINTEDAAGLNIKDGDFIKLTSRRGELTLKAAVNKRGNPPPGQVFLPFFDENKLINLLTLDSYCPISKEPDYKKCAVKIQKT